MVKVKYIDHEGDADEVVAFGVKFTDGKAVPVSDDVAALLKGNRFFEVQTSAAKDEPKTTVPLDPNGKPASNEAPPAGGKPPSEDILEAVHRGRGVYAVVKGDEILKEGLTKEDAEAFNALPTEEAKEEHLTEPTVAANAAESSTNQQ